MRDRHIRLDEPSKSPWADSFAACNNGPCQQGRKLCPSPDACRRAEKPDQSYRQLFWAIALAIGVAVWVAVIWWAAR